MSFKTITTRFTLIVTLLTGCSEAQFSSKISKEYALTANSLWDGAAGEDGVTCWQAITSDQNGDGLLNIHDCQGEPGAQGLQGLTGNDGRNGTNGVDGQNGTNGTQCFQSSGDSNGDGALSSLDCRGSQGPAGLNGQNGTNGQAGSDCHAGLSDQNGDGVINTQDCRGQAGTPRFDGFETIGCATGGKMPGGVDPSNLMNVEATSTFTWAQCSPGKRLVAAGLVGTYLPEALIPMRPYYGGALIEHGVATGRAEPTDLFPNKIQCFIGNRNPTECSDPPCPDLLFPMGLVGWGLCAPISGTAMD